MGRKKWPCFLPLRLLESELISCKEDRESWRNSGGNYTNHLSTSCFLHELAQQKAIFRLKCFKLQWPWRVWIIWLTADAWCCFKHLDVWQWFLSTRLPQTPARCCFCEWLHLAHSVQKDVYTICQGLAHHAQPRVRLAEIHLLEMSSSPCWFSSCLPLFVKIAISPQIWFFPYGVPFYALRLQ